jgi:hypothetical protein
MSLINWAYINEMNADQLRREVANAWEEKFALRDAFKELPEVPSVEALRFLSELADFSRDWSRGKTMQRTAERGVVPPKTEYEMGAGLWGLIRDALVSANAEVSQPKPSKE